MCMSSFLTPLQTPSSYRGGVDMALKHPNNHCPPPHPPQYVPFHPLAWLTSKNTNTSTTRDSSKERENEKEKKESRCQSPRSVLDASKELESRKNRVGLGIVVALEEEDEANITSPVHCQTLLIAVSPRCQTPRPYKKEFNTRHESSPIAIPSHAGYTTLLHVTHHEHEEEEEEDEFDEVGDSFLWPAGKEVVVEEEEEDEDDEEEREKVEERERRKGFVRSIFSVGSPLVSALHEENDDDDDEEEEVGWPIMEEVLKACFLCKRSFGDGKDIYMYRGDRAFCSEECRYRQIVVDEYHERKIEGLRPY